MNDLIEEKAIYNFSQILRRANVSHVVDIRSIQQLRKVILCLQNAVGVTLVRRILNKTCKNAIHCVRCDSSPRQMTTTHTLSPFAVKTYLFLNNAHQFLLCFSVRNNQHNQSFVFLLPFKAAQMFLFELS